MKNLIILCFFALPLISCSSSPTRMPSSEHARSELEERLYQDYGLEFRRLTEGKEDIPTVSEYENFLTKLHSTLSAQNAPKYFYPTYFEVGGIFKSAMGLKLAAEYHGSIHPHLNHYNPEHVAKELMKTLKVAGSPEAIAFEKNDKALTALIIHYIYQIENKGYYVLSNKGVWLRGESIESSEFQVKQKETFLYQLVRFDYLIPQMDKTDYKRNGRVYLDFSPYYNNVSFYNHIRPIDAANLELYERKISFSSKEEKMIKANIAAIIQKAVNEDKYDYEVKVSNVNIPPEFQDKEFLRKLPDPDPRLFSCSEEAAWVRPSLESAANIGGGVAGTAAIGAMALTPGILIAGPSLTTSGAVAAKVAISKMKTRRLMVEALQGDGETLRELAKDVSKRLGRKVEMSVIVQRVQEMDKLRDMCFSASAMDPSSAKQYSDVVDAYVKRYGK